VKKSLRKLSQKLSYMDTLWEAPNYTARSGGTTSGSVRTSAGSFEPVTGATSAMRTSTHYSGAGCTPPHYSAGKGPADVEEEDNDDESDEEDEAPGFHIHHHQRDPYH
jgi:hypothetical protein